MSIKKKKPVSGKGQTGFKSANKSNYIHNPQASQVESLLTAAIGVSKNGGLIAKYTQKETVLELLKMGTVTSLDLEEKFNILNPPAVIHSLRKNHKIHTNIVYQLDSRGFEHNIAQYSLLELNKLSNEVVK